MCLYEIYRACSDIDDGCLPEWYIFDWSLLSQSFDSTPALLERVHKEKNVNTNCYQWLKNMADIYFIKNTAGQVAYVHPSMTECESFKRHKALLRLGLAHSCVCIYATFLPLTSICYYVCLWKYCTDFCHQFILMWSVMLEQAHNKRLCFIDKRLTLSNVEVRYIDMLILCEFVKEVIQISGSLHCKKLESLNTIADMIPCDSDTQGGNNYGGARPKIYPTAGQNGGGSGQGGSNSGNPGGNQGSGQGSGGNGRDQNDRNRKSVGDNSNNKKKIEAKKKNRKGKHGILPDGLTIEFAVGLLSKEVSQLKLLQHTREVQNIRHQFASCLSMIPSLLEGSGGPVPPLPIDSEDFECTREEGGVSDDNISDDCELCLCIELLLHHVPHCSLHWQECKECYQMSTIIKTHIQQCCIQEQQHNADSMIDDSDEDSFTDVHPLYCPVVVCSSVRKKLKDFTIRGLELFWKKPDVWDKVRSYLSAQYYVPDISDADLLLEFESQTTSMLMTPSMVQNDSLLLQSHRHSPIPGDIEEVRSHRDKHKRKAAVDADNKDWKLQEEDEEDQRSWLYGADPVLHGNQPYPSVLSDDTDSTDNHNIEGRVVYSTPHMLSMMAAKWKTSSTSQHEGVLFSPFENLLTIYNDQYKKNQHWLTQGQLGRGMFGRCFYAVDFVTGARFCVKTIELDGFDPTECDVWGRLDHPLVARMYGAVLQDNVVHVFSQLGEGGSLDDLIRRNGCLTMHSSLVFCRQLFECLHYLQQATVLHEDIKADNIVFNKNTRSILLVDFGVSRFLGEVGRVKPGLKSCGAQTHCSPEKITSRGYDYKSDVWAAVCTLFQMLTGEAPWMRSHSELSTLVYIIGTREPPFEDLPSNIQKSYPDVYKFIRRAWNTVEAERPYAQECLSDRALATSNANDFASNLWSMQYSTRGGDNAGTGAQPSLAEAGEENMDTSNAPIPMLSILHRTMHSNCETCQHSHQHTHVSDTKHGSEDHSDSDNHHDDDDDDDSTGLTSASHHMDINNPFMDSNSDSFMETINTNIENEAMLGAMNDLVRAGDIQPFINTMMVDEPGTGLEDFSMSMSGLQLTGSADDMVVRFKDSHNLEVCQIRLSAHNVSNWFYIIKYLINKVREHGIRSPYVILHNGRPLQLADKPSHTGELTVLVSTRPEDITASTWSVKDMDLDLK